MDEGLLARLAAVNRLLVLARDLLQAVDLTTVVELVGRAFQELLAADEALLLLNFADQEVDTGFDRAGFLQPPDRAGALYRQARQALAQQSPIVLPQMAVVPVTPPNPLAAEGASALALPFPPLRAIGVLAARWQAGTRQPSAQESMLVLRHLGELAGAALGTVESRILLETQVTTCSEQLVEAAREHAQELQRRDRLEEEIRRISDTDVLTGMLNRRGFFKQAEQSFKLARRQGLPSVLVFADIDGLKAVNDDLGHEMGDRLIQDCAWILRNSFRDSDVVARFGGDEFVAFSLDAAEPEVILARIQANIENVRRQTPRPYLVSFSIGVVQCEPSSGLSLSDYLGLADEKMYGQKRGRAR